MPEQKEVRETHPELYESSIVGFDNEPIMVENSGRQIAEGKPEEHDRHDLARTYRFTLR